MAATVNDNAPPSAALSPRSSSGEGIGSPQPLSRRTSSGTARNPSPPWNEVVVRGPEAEVLVAPPAPSVVAAATVVEDQNSVQSKIESLTEGLDSETQQEGSENGNGNGKKVVWNKPSNGGPEIGPVMGAVSWPTLSESTKAAPKPPAADLSKNPSDTPVSVPQVISPASLSSPVSSSSALQRHVTANPNNPNPSATQHHGRGARQRTLNREGGGSSSSNGGLSHQPPPQSSLVGEASHDSNSSVRSGFGGSDSSERDHHGHGHNNAYREGGQRGGGNHRNFRRTNSGPHATRGDGSFGGRRDQDRANHDWNHQRSFNGRDNAGPPQRAGPRGFMRPLAPTVASYVPPPIGAYTNPMNMPPEMQPLYYFAPHPGMPFVAQMPPQFYTPPFDPQLHAKILKQIEYYFSNENLIRDIFLRQNMDEHGWVPVQLIASFNKVTELTTNIQLILDVVRASTLVEVQGDKIRRRDDWIRWMMPSSVQFPAASSSQSPRMSGQGTLAAHLQGLSVDENSANQSNSSGQLDVRAGTLLRSSSGEVRSEDRSSSNGR